MAFETAQEPLHNILRAFFKETKDRNPRVFVNALLGNLSKILWFPPEGWEHPAREEAREGESKPEWERMERLATEQRKTVVRIAQEIVRAARDAKVAGIQFPDL